MSIRTKHKSKSYSEVKDDQNRLSGALGAALDAIAVAHDLDMTMTKDQSIDGTSYNIICKFSIIYAIQLIFLELHDPLRQLVIMSENDKDIDKNKVEIVANAAAKIAVSFSSVLIFYSVNVI